MKIEIPKVIITLEHPDELRALQIACLFTSSAITDCQRKMTVSDRLIVHGADPSNIHDLVKLREHLDRIAESI